MVSAVLGVVALLGSTILFGANALFGAIFAFARRTPDWSEPPPFAAQSNAAPRQAPPVAHFPLTGHMPTDVRRVLRDAQLEG